MTMCKVVNKYKTAEYDIDITRQGFENGFWGNPYKLVCPSDKEERKRVLSQYEDWLLYSEGGRLRLYRLGELRGKTLGCVCKPKECHGDILAEAVNTLPAVIDKFYGPYHFLSNFWQAPDKWNVEAEYQAAKCADKVEARKFLPTMDPFEAKNLGFKVTLRPDWDRVKVGIMIHYVREKFRNYADIRDQLLLTCDAELIEGNHWCDDFWGVCGRGVKCRKGKHNGTTGQNVLGQILMELRSDFLVEAMQEFKA